jgi:hypothetical protein
LLNGKLFDTLDLFKNHWFSHKSRGICRKWRQIAVFLGGSCLETLGFLNNCIEKNIHAHLWEDIYFMPRADELRRLADFYLNESVPKLQRIFSPQ